MLTLAEVNVCNDCSVRILGPFDERKRLHATDDMPVIQFSPVMNGSTLRINCSISDGFEPSLRIILIEGCEFKEIKLPQEHSEEQASFVYSISLYREISTGCGDGADEHRMVCYSFPITIISTNMDRAMVMCGASKAGCSTTFLPTLGIIRVSDPIATVSTSISDDPGCQSVEPNSDVPPTVTGMFDDMQGNVTVDLKDDILIVVTIGCSLSSFVVGSILGLVAAVLIQRWCPVRSVTNRHNGPFYQDLHRYPPP